MVTVFDPPVITTFPLAVVTVLVHPFPPEILTVALAVVTVFSLPVMFTVPAALVMVELHPVTKILPPSAFVTVDVLPVI